MSARVSGMLFIGMFLAAAAAAQPTQSAALGSTVERRDMFRDCPECPELVSVPGGAFTMGAAPDEELREGLASSFRGRSEPRRTIRVPPFAAGRLEVTRGQYRAFAESTGRASDGCFYWKGDESVFDEARDWRSPGYHQEDNHPVTCVSWNDALAYTEWLSARTGKRYRLLSEAEWEYAARAGTTTARYWSDAPANGCDYANGADISTRARVPGSASWPIIPCNDRYAYTAPAGQFRANAFGLHDVLGNAAEWTQDCWNESYRGLETSAVAVTRGECSMRVVRGGAWDEGPAGLRAAYRVGSPTVVRVWGRGFRVARDL